MSRKKLKKLRPRNQLVTLKWVDTQACQGWTDIKEATTFNLVEYVGHGELVAWNDDFILLAAISGNGQINSYVYYPVGCVTEIKEVQWNI